MPADYVNICRKVIHMARIIRVWEASKDVFCNPAGSRRTERSNEKEKTGTDGRCKEMLPQDVCRK